MLLAIDIGNTNITLGVHDGQAWRAHWRLQTVSDKTADEYGVTLSALLAGVGGTTAVTQVVLCSVVPALTGTFATLSQRYLGHQALIISMDSDLGITIATDTPAEVGVDRLVNAAAAYALYPGPSVIIDMGTATKFDVVTSDGRFLGGVIAPGMQLTADVLAGRAAQLRKVALSAPPQAIGRNTIHAIQSGLVYGYVSLIEGLLQRVLVEHPDQDQPITILGTGGLISFVADHTSVIQHVDPWLTLTGLCLIHQRMSD